jgi:ATP-dependent Lon protease
MTVPIFVARGKTKYALDQAFQNNREVVPVTQRDDAVEEPGFGDVYEVGVLARLPELERFPDGTTMKIYTSTPARRDLPLHRRGGRVSGRNYTR